jgi:hypothetical protein
MATTEETKAGNKDDITTSATMISQEEGKKVDLEKKIPTSMTKI